MNERKNNIDPNTSTAVKKHNKFPPLYYINVLCLVLAAVIFLSAGIYIGIMIERNRLEKVTYTFTEPTIETTVPIETEAKETPTKSTEEPTEASIDISKETALVRTFSAPIYNPLTIEDDPINDISDTPAEPSPEPIPEVTEAPESEETVSTVRSEAVELIACVVYQEAGSDYICDDCRYRVADIVLNRVADERFPNTIYGVLTQPSQYGSYSYTGVVWPSRANNSGEAHAVERAYTVAENVVNGIQHSSLYGEGYVWQAGFVQGSDGFWCCGHYYGR